MDRRKVLANQIMKAREELERRINILNETPIKDTHPDMINALTLEVTAQSMRLNALIGMAKGLENPDHKNIECGGNCKCTQMD